MPQQSRLHLAASPLGDRPLAWAQRDTSAPRSQSSLLPSCLTPEPQAVRCSLVLLTPELVTAQCYVRLGQELLLTSPSSSARPCVQQQFSSFPAGLAP